MISKPDRFIIDVHGHPPLDAKMAQLYPRTMDRNGVERLFLAGLGAAGWPPFPDDSQVAGANAEAFALCEAHPDRYRAYVYLNPNGDWRTELDKWVDHPAFVGIKLWIALRDPSGDSDICLPLLRWAADAGAVVLMHSFFRTGGELKGELNPAEIARLARLVPGVRIILAHLGGNFSKGAQAVADQSNVYLDVSGGPPARGCVETAVRRCGVERVLFGSDLPCRTIQSQLAKVSAAALNEDDRRKILRDNAVGLFGLPG